MSSSPEPPRSPREPPRHGFLAWTVFVLAVVAMLLVVAGCVAMVYRPVVEGLTS